MVELPSTAARAWRKQAALVVLGVLIVVAAYLQTFEELWAAWWGTSAYNHCALIPLIAAYLAWYRRDRLLRTAPSVSLLGAAFVAVNGAVWLLGELAYVNVLEHVAVVGCIIGAIWAMVGNDSAKTVMFPLAYLYFMVPEGGFLVPYLQDWTAAVLVTLLRATDIPVFLEGRYLQIPSGHFHVAKACSGINYLLATLAVGSMFAYLSYRSNWRRAAFMALAILVPLIANGVRAYGIVMIAHLSDYRYAMGVDHFIYGWLFFGIVIFILFAVGRTFADTDEPGATHPAPPTVSARARSVLPALLVLVVAAALPHAALARVQQSVPEGDGYALVALTPWRGPLPPTAELRSRFPGAHRMLAGAYTRGAGAGVDVQLAVYLAQAQGAEIVNYSNAPYDDGAWRLVSGEALTDTGVPDLPRVHLRRIRGATEERLLWWWYQVGDEATAGALDAKFHELSQKLLGRYRGASVVVVSTPVDDASDGEARATANLRDFLATFRDAEIFDPARASAR